MADRHGRYEKDWNPYAEQVHDRKAADEWSAPRAVRRTQFGEFFRISPGERVLDAGCGHGEYSQWAIECGAVVHAFDYAPSMVESTRQHLSTHGLSAHELLVASVTDIPYPDAHFDVVMCLAVLDHLTDAQAVAAVKELARVVKPGGRVYLNVPMKQAYWWRAGHKLMQRLGLFPPGDTRWYTPEELRLLAVASDLAPGKSIGLWALPPLSGIYTTDIRRISILPGFVAKWFDMVHLWLETRLRRLPWFKRFCLHYFLETTKAAPMATPRSAIGIDLSSSSDRLERPAKSRSSAPPGVTT